MVTTLQAPRPSSFPELDTSDKPPFMRLPLLDAGQIAQIDERYRLRLRMLQAVDEALGGIERLLAERGLLESTYIVFTSDHGWHQGPSTAVMLAKKGVAVEVVTPDRMLGFEVGATNFPNYLRELYRHQVKLTPDLELRSARH